MPHKQLVYRNTVTFSDRVREYICLTATWLKLDTQLSLFLSQKQGPQNGFLLPHLESEGQKHPLHVILVWSIMIHDPGPIIQQEVDDLPALPDGENTHLFLQIQLVHSINEMK